MHVCIISLAIVLAAILGIIPDALAHGVTEDDKGYILKSVGCLISSAAKRYQTALKIILCSEKRCR